MARKQVTMKHVAQEMGVSIVSVSKALSGKEGVSEDLREKIVDKAQKLGYELRTDKRRSENDIANVGIVVSSRFVSNDSFYFETYQKMIVGLSQKGYIGILEIVPIENERRGILPNIIKLNTVNIVVVIGEMESPFLDSLMATGLGVIFFDFENEDYNVDSIISDSINGGFLLTRYLINAGHEKIGFVGDYRSTRSILDRYMGYLKCLIVKGRRINDEWVIPDRDKNGEYTDFMLPVDMPDAFVCNCDEVAYRFIDRLEEAGYRVPEDISVVGYDDYIKYSRIKIGLTTYQVDLDGMISRCIHLIEQKTANSNYRQGTAMVYGRLVVRDTVKILN